MWDFAMIAIGLGFFAIAIAYVRVVRSSTKRSPPNDRVRTSGPRHHPFDVLPGLRPVATGEVLNDYQWMVANRVVFALILLCAKPLGVYMAAVFDREKTFFDVLARPVERLIYKLTGIDEAYEMSWSEYATTMLVFSFVTMMVTYAVERLQHWLPLNPQGLANVAPDLAINTAASFTTNTNWQGYVPEATMSYLTQMATLAYHNFVSAAVGMALAIAFVRGIAGREKKTLGNFWVDHHARNAVGVIARKPATRTGAGLARCRPELPAL